MFGLYFARGGPDSYAEVMACDKERFNRFFHAMLDAGVYFAPSAFEAGFVSAAHGTREIARDARRGRPRVRTRCADIAVRARCAPTNGAVSADVAAASRPRNVASARQKFHCNSLMSKAFLPVAPVACYDSIPFLTTTTALDETRWTHPFANALARS